jgi:hypothetical protein
MGARKLTIAIGNPFACAPSSAFFVFLFKRHPCNKNGPAIRSESPGRLIPSAQAHAVRSKA